MRNIKGETNKELLCSVSLATVDLFVCECGRGWSQWVWAGVCWWVCPGAEKLSENKFCQKTEKDGGISKFVKLNSFLIEL